MPDDSQPAAPTTDDETLPRTACPLVVRSNFGQLDQPTPWVWHGYVPRAGLTLLTGQWKVGKTSLLAALLARLGAGGTLAGQRVEPGRAVVITEEGTGLWGKRLVRHDIGDWVSFAIRPFARKPLPSQWQHLLDDLSELHGRRPIDLIVIDPLISVLAGQEEGNAAAMTDVLRPLRELTSSGPGVLILHHPRKGLTLGEQGARGTGALPAFVDVLMEMQWPGPAATETRRRWLTAWSRFDATPRRVLMDRSADGTDFIRVPIDPSEPSPLTDEVQRVLEEMLVTTPGLTAQEINARWPAGLTRPCASWLQRRLVELVHAGRLDRRGRGHRYSPNRYAVAVKLTDVVNEDAIASLVALDQPPHED